MVFYHCIHVTNNAVPRYLLNIYIGMGRNHTRFYRQCLARNTAVIVRKLLSMTQNSRLKFFSLLIIHLWDTHSDIQGVWRSHLWAIWEIQDGRQYGHQHLGDSWKCNNFQNIWCKCLILVSIPTFWGISNHTEYIKFWLEHDEKHNYNTKTKIFLSIK